jgi:hypothetical protein
MRYMHKPHRSGTAVTPNYDKIHRSPPFDGVKQSVKVAAVNATGSTSSPSFGKKPNAERVNVASDCG